MKLVSCHDLGVDEDREISINAIDEEMWRPSDWSNLSAVKSINFTLKDKNVMSRSNTEPKWAKFDCSYSPVCRPS